MQNVSLSSVSHSSKLNLDLQSASEGKAGALSGDWIPNLWDLILSLGRDVRVELNYRTPRWYHRSAWWCGRKPPHIGTGNRILRDRRDITWNFREVQCGLSAFYQSTWHKPWAVARIQRGEVDEQRPGTAMSMVWYFNWIWIWKERKCILLIFLVPCWEVTME